MTRRISRDKWILYRHTKDLNLVVKVAELLKKNSRKIHKEERAYIQNKLADLGLYNERNIDRPLDAINHKINTLCFFMFGYKEKTTTSDRFIFSPLGNLFLQNIDNDDNRTLIFLCMLWFVQFEHPHSGTPCSISLYPFRLIFKLLRDSRLNNRLYAFEVAYLVVFTQGVDSETYEKLVNDIIALRKLNNEEIRKKFAKDSHAYVNSLYEWDYYTSDLLASEKIVEKYEGEVIGKLQHGNTKTYRKITRNYIKIPDNLLSFIDKLESEYSFKDKPLELNDETRPKNDVVKEVYGFYPKILLETVGAYSEKIDEILNLPKLIEEYSNNNKGKQAYLFEEVLEEGFNQFYNVSAKRISGAGNTDLECVYLEKNKKFSVDAKSTKNKLSLINSGRLNHHRDIIGGKYTIVITSRYVPAVLRDIKDTNIVILLATTFSEFLYNNMAIDNREIDYGNIDRIIEENLGTDVSRKVSDITIDDFGVSNNFAF